jgi:hypothetical protein
VQGVQGSDFEQTGPSPFKQSRLEPITLPPFADAKQDCKMRRGWEGNGAHTLALKMYAYCKTTNRTAKSDVSANFIRAHEPSGGKEGFQVSFPAVGLQTYYANVVKLLATATTHLFLLLMCVPALLLLSIPPAV